MNPNTEDFRAAMAAQVASNNAADITAPIRINDDANRTREQRFDPTEADRAPAGHPLSGCTDPNGVPIPYSAALKADPASVIVTYNNLPMRLSQAYAIGLTTPEQVQSGKSAATPSPTQTTQPHQKETEEKPAGDTGTPDTDTPEGIAEVLRTPMYDSVDEGNLALLQDAAQRSGFDWGAVVRDGISEGFDPEGATVTALAEASGRPAADIVDAVESISDHVVTTLVDLAGDDAVEAAMADTVNWQRAAIASVSSGSLVPLAAHVAAVFERQQATGK